MKTAGFASISYFYYYYYYLIFNINVYSFLRFPCLFSRICEMEKQTLKKLNENQKIPNQGL